MAIKTQISKNGRVITLSIEGRFDFSVHQSFREAYCNNTQRNRQYCLNLSETSYIDSSGLGMILLLKNHTEKTKSEIVIKNPSESVHKILDIAQFHRLMKIEL